MRNPFTRENLLAMVSAPLIWAAHFVACYVLASIACAYDFSGARLGIVLVTALALALLAGIGLSNWRKWNRARQTHSANLRAAHAHHPDQGGNNLGIFFAVTSMMLCALSAVALIWVAFPAALLPPCAA